MLSQHFRSSSSPLAAHPSVAPKPPGSRTAQSRPFRPSRSKHHILFFRTACWRPSCWHALSETRGRSPTPGTPLRKPVPASCRSLFVDVDAKRPGLRGTVGGALHLLCAKCAPSRLVDNKKREKEARGERTHDCNVNPLSATG